MKLKVVKIKSFFIIFMILSLAFSFPLQVVTKSPLPSLISYCFLGILIGLMIITNNKDSFSFFIVTKITLLDKMILLYVFVVVISSLLQVLLFYMQIVEAFNVIVVYVFPGIFYWYFKWKASENDLRAMFYAAAVAGLLAGIYFDYDTYLKVVVGQISDYAQSALDYSIARHNTTKENMNQMNVLLGYRSFGLLETHSVSGAWVAIGAFAALCFSNKKITQAMIFFLYSSMLIIGMNFTNICGYFIIFFSIYVRSNEKKMAILEWNKQMILIIVTILIASMAVLIFKGNELYEFVTNMLMSQSHLIFGTGGKRTSFLTIIAENWQNYINYISLNPLALIIGDGFGSYGMPKGGDVGWLETMARFGVPLFFLFMLGFIKILIHIRFLLKLNQTQCYQQSLMFAASVIFLIIFNEMHYSIWMAKSILPILFIALALYQRYSQFPIYRQELSFGR